MRVRLRVRVGVGVRVWVWVGVGVRVWIGVGVRGRGSRASMACAPTSSLPKARPAGRNPAAALARRSSRRLLPSQAPE